MIPEPYFAIFMSLVVATLTVVCLRLYARIGELARNADHSAELRAEHDARRDRETAQLQRTISTLVRERDEVIARTRALLLMNRRRDFTG